LIRGSEIQKLVRHLLSEGAPSNLVAFLNLTLTEEGPSPARLPALAKNQFLVARVLLEKGRLLAGGRQNGEAAICYRLFLDPHK
jgi:hypothetical protein